MGGCYEVIPEGTTRVVRLAAPLLDPHYRRGYCIVYLDSRPEERGVLRYTVKIDFDTTDLATEVPDTKPCDTEDQDPFDNCKPVDCDTRYNGLKPHYNPRTKRCVEAPPCVATNVESPDVTYDQDSNKCVNNFTLSDNDIDYIRSLTKGHTRKAKDIIIIKNKQPILNSTVHDRQDSGNDDEPNSTQTLLQSFNTAHKMVKPSISCRIFDYFETYKDTFKVLALIVTVQCCLICTMLYLLAKTCQCDKEKPLVSRFFNYRHDVSVTTPLIDTSDHDTETTYQYLSDTSTNVDKKIKCYKACHKNRTRSARCSMSDDILAKCLTRRDWKQRSDAIPEMKPEESAQSDVKHNQDRLKQTETKVNFENEVRRSKSDIKPKGIKSIVKRKDENIDIEPSSEKEIKCLTYNYDNCDNNSSEKKEKKTISLSSEKSAQACFSNDSIDDFLSERGMIFLAGENISKYTFSSDSTYNLNLKNSGSELSSKTSKNNIVQNVLSLLQRKQHGPASDPGGGQKSTVNLNLELLHMSQASVFSSTNDSECVGGFKRTMDSRTSL